MTYTEEAGRHAQRPATRTTTDAFPHRSSGRDTVADGDAYERLVDALGPDVSYERDGTARARCPAHDGRSRTSLSIRRGHEGVVLHCFAGCDYTDVLDALGLAPRDLFDGDPPAGHTRAPRRRRRTLTPFQKAIPDPDHLVERCAQRAHLEHGDPYEPPPRQAPEDCPVRHGPRVPDQEPWEAEHRANARLAALRWAIEYAREHPEALHGESLEEHLLRLGVVSFG